METKPYLIFNLHEVTYAIPIDVVKEIFYLPELTPIADAPSDIVGILNWRQQVIPVMHLDLRLGNPMPGCQLRDNVIVMEWENLFIGIIVNSATEVKTIDSELIEPQIDYGRVRNINPVFISGVAKVGDLEEIPYGGRMIVLLNPEALIRQPDTVEALMEDVAASTTAASEPVSESESPKNATVGHIVSSFYDLCCPGATPKARSIFQRRAEILRRATKKHSSKVIEKIGLAAFKLNGEYFGIDLDLVLEFTKIGELTSIPKSSAPIVGQMNWRGDILTSIDIRHALNLPTAPVNHNSQVVAIEVNNITAGLIVDEIFQVMYINPNDINSLPLAVSSGNEEYLRGTIPYLEKMLSIIDLPKILSRAN